MRRRAKTDKNQAVIVAALRSAGATVCDLSPVGKGIPDLLVGFEGLTFLIEVKNADSHSRGEHGLLTQPQVEWMDSWKGGAVHIVYTAEEALEVIHV